jgi:hypothetical protein
MGVVSDIVTAFQFGTARSRSKSRNGGGKPMIPADDLAQQEERVGQGSTLTI